MVRDVATGRLRTTFAGAGAVAFAPDGRTLAFGGEDGVVLRDLDTGRQRLALGARSDALAFAPDGLTLAVGSGDRDENEGAVLLRAGTESRAGARIP